MNVENLPSLLIPEEVMALLRISYPTLRRWKKSGILKAIALNKFSPKYPRMRFLKSDIIKLMGEKK